MDTTVTSSKLHLTMANEDYLECIVRISRESADPSQGVRSVDMLTEQGREIGEAVWYRHRLLRTFLVQELGVEFETADAEACMMEHALSEDTMGRWLRYLKAQGIAIEQ